MPSDADLSRSLVARLTDLVDIASVSGDEGPITDYVRGAIPAEFQVVHDDDTVLVAVADVSQPATLLAGHTDTVPVEENFPSSVSSSSVHGRGTADMKSGLAVMLELAHWWAALDFDDKRASGLNPGLLFFGREELSQGHNPLPAAFESCRHLKTASMAVLLEPTANVLQLGCVGNLNLTLSFSGKAAHSARPWLGENAAHRASVFVSGLDPEPKAASVDGLTFYETATVTALRSGTARNVVPASAEIDVNVRYRPGRQPDDVEEEWRRRVEGMADLHVVGHARSAPASGDDAMVRRFGVAVGGAAQPKQAWTNVADFAAHGIPAVNYGPGDPAYAHTRDEQVEIAALTAGFRGLQKFFTSTVDREHQ